MKYLLRHFQKSASKTILITNPYGLHLRPCTLLASLAKKFQTDIEIHLGANIADAKNLHQLLALNIAFEDTITIKAFGKDSKEVINQLSSLLENHHDTQETPKESPVYNYVGKSLEGKAISSGLAIGKIWHIPSEEFTNTSTKTKETFDEAKTRVLSYLSKKKNPIFQAHYALIEALQATTFESLEEEINKHIATLKNGANSSKIDDYHNILRYFQGTKETFEAPDHPTVLVAYKLLPSDIESIAKSSTKGVIISHEIAPNSHVSLLLRSHQIPTVSLPKDVIDKLTQGDILIDGFRGIVVTSLTKEDREFVSSYLQKEKLQNQNAFERRFLPATTKSGKTIDVVANIHDIQTAKEARENGATKVGLLRSEFIFKLHQPSFKEQVEFFTEIFDLFDEVTVRTLDVGGDKELAYIQIPKEQNPFLGIRGIRLLQTHRDIISTQLEAILTASKGKKIKIMFPMVATPREFIEAKELTIKLCQKLHIDPNNIQLGIMIEIPSVLFMLEQFNKIVDFYSIGTNDLHQYLFAVDRTHSTFKIEDEELIFEVISKITKEATKPVSICGELASDVDKIDKLLLTNIDILSVTPKMVPLIKERIRDV